MTVVAEGIETAGELQWPCDNGAHLLQGFYLARPAANPVRTLVLPEEVAAGADRGRMME